MRARVVFAAAMFACLAAPACARARERSAGGKGTSTVTPFAASPDGAPESTLDLELLDTIGTDTSMAGKRFRAVVRADVLDADAGTILVERGAIVYGTVEQVSPAPEPYLVLDLDVVRTEHGDAPIYAKLKGAKATPVAGADAIYDPATSAYDAVFTPSYPPGESGYAAPGEGVLYVDHYDEKAHALRLPAGTVLIFSLRAPLVPGREGPGIPTPPR